MAHLDLRPLTDELASFFDAAPARLRARSAQAAAEEERWETALERLTALGESVESANLPPRAWCGLVVAMWTAAVEGDLPGGLRESFARWSSLAWPQGALPWEAGPVLARCVEIDRLRIGARLGRFLESYFPHFALGPYATAHFQELEALRRDAPFPATTELADRFERAAALFERHERDDEARHCRLRAGVALHRAGRDHPRARVLLRGVDADASSARDRLWYATGLAHSPFWLDRVRTADALDALGAGVRNARPGFGEVGEAEVLRAVAELFAELPLRLQPAEEDRLGALLDSMRDPRARGELAAGLTLRRQVAPLSDAPLDDLEGLGGLVPSVGGDEVREHPEHMTCVRALIAARRGESPQPRPPGLEGAPELRLGWLCVEAITAANADEPASLRNSLSRLAATLPVAQPATWRPIAVVWPSVVEWCRSHRRALGEPPASDVVAAAEELAAAWAPRAPAPGYGWWPLAAQLQGAKLHAAGASVAARAVNDDTPGDEELVRNIIGRAVSWAAQHADDQTLRWWLEEAERRWG